LQLGPDGLLYVGQVGENLSDQKQTSIRSIAVFCGSNFGVSPVYADAARALGTEMGRRGSKLI
jgi:predicted Rossmann-fold nucleotide-binding protein